MRCLHYRAMDGYYAHDPLNRQFVAHICGDLRLCDKFSAVPAGATGVNDTIESSVECCEGSLK